MFAKKKPKTYNVKLELLLIVVGWQSERTETIIECLLIWTDKKKKTFSSTFALFENQIDKREPERSQWTSGLPDLNKYKKSKSVKVDSKSGNCGWAGGNCCISVKQVGGEGLGSAQAVPRRHHLLWVSHGVLPLLHCFWDRAAEPQLNLQTLLS